jgi:UDP-glucose 4-epimerase
VTDVVNALIQLATHPQAVGEIYNLGCDQEVTILDLAKRIKALTSSTSPLTFISYDRAYEEGFEDMRRRVPDISKLRKLIGYHPQVKLDDILTSVIEYQRTKITHLSFAFSGEPRLGPAIIA